MATFSTILIESFRSSPTFAKQTRSSKPLAVYVGFYKRLAAGGTRLPRISPTNQNLNTKTFQKQICYIQTAEKLL
jgi:hypothetical protein